MGAATTEQIYLRLASLLLQCVFLLASGFANAQDQLHTYPHWQAMRVIKDSHGEWTANEAWQHSLSQEVTHLSHPHQAIQAIDAKVVWAAWSLPDAVTQQLPVWLGIHLPACVDVQLWLRWNRGEWQLQPLEHEQRVTKPGEGHLLPVWAIHDASLRHIDVLLKIQNPGLVQLPLWLHKPENFMRLQWKYALMYGVLLVLLLTGMVYALSLLRFFERQALFVFIGILFMHFAFLCWTSGLGRMLLPALQRSHAVLAAESAICLWVVLSTFHMRSTVCLDNKFGLLGKSLRCWGLCAGLLILLSSGLWFVHDHRMTGKILSAHMLFMLLCCAWHLKQKINFKSMCHAAVWLLYTLALSIYAWADKLRLHPADALLLSSVMSVSAILLTGWANCWRLMSQRKNLQQKLALVQHDMWQPLQSVQLYAHAMTQAGPEQLPRLVSGLQLAAGHVNDFMQQMQILSGVHKSEAHWLSEQQMVTADALLAPLITECQPLAHWQRVSLRYRKNQSILQVNVPAVQRILRNLINNALAYTPAGGRVLIGCRSRAGQLWIFCLDNGKGMSPEQLKQCTQAYRRFETNADGCDHQGLGLYSVKKIAEQMRLPLRMQSTQGKGSMMGFAVPLAATAGRLGPAA